MILPPLYQKIWRRIWWTLYIEDMHYAAAYGRLPHIHPDFCDIQPLSEDDFQDYDWNEFGPASRDMKQDCMLYIIYFAELSLRGTYKPFYMILVVNYAKHALFDSLPVYCRQLFDVGRC